MTLLGSDFDPSPDHGNAPIAPGFVSGELLPQLPSWNPDWTLEQYHNEIEVYLRKLYEFLRKFGGKISEAIYQGTTGHEIPDPTPTTSMRNSDIGSLVRMYNTGESAFRYGSYDRDLLWINTFSADTDNTITVNGGAYDQDGRNLALVGTQHNNLNIKAGFLVATPSGLTAPQQTNTSFISGYHDGATAVTANRAFYTGIVVDKLVDIANLVVPFIVSGDFDLYAINVNGTSQSISESKPFNRKSHQLASGWRYGSNSIEVVTGNNLGATAAGSILVEWGTPTW